ncbi:MAG: methyltransferase [Acidobacteriota bacterium]|jgi:hypothetical protein|nr:methyltransferase [Acidobacteriota bacterium]
MTVPPFDPKELVVTGELPNPFGPPSPLLSYPVTRKEGQLALLRRRPVWQLSGVEQVLFAAKCNPDNIARGFVFDGTKTPPTGGTDMFGIEWEYIPSVGGAMVRPGKPFIADANEIKDKVRWPDIDAWDWQGCADANVEYLGGSVYNCCWFLNGWYERLISFMDFEGAVMAIADEDQQDAVKEFFDRLTDLYIRILEKFLEYFPQIDGFCLHDDWGGQKDTFFSPATVAEMIVPYMRRVTDFIHAKGKYCELHSCGQLLKQVPNIIAAGWDSWMPQAMNDTHTIYDLYGDKLIVGVIPEPFDPEKTTEGEQRAFAKAYAERFCRPDKPSVYNLYGAPYLTPAFREELYKQSRICYGR